MTILPHGLIQLTRRFSGLAALIGLIATQAFASQGSYPTRSVEVVSDASSLVPQLRRNISLSLRGVSVETALREIGKRADVPITYNDVILPKAASVWLTRDDIRTDE